MKFLIKTLASTVLGILGSYLGGLANMWTSLFLGFVFSVVGWYWAKFRFEGSNF